MKSIRRKKNKEKSRIMRSDNRGMSLLELIIAVAIFSIAAVSLLQAFVTSGRINKKSNLYLEATTTAQNVMEEIKAKSFTDLVAAFNYPIDKNNNCRFSFLESQEGKIYSSSNKSGSLKILEVLPTTSSDGTTTYRDVTGGDDASVISENSGETYTLNPRTKGSNASKYYFEMTGVVCLNETFDVLVEFDGSDDTAYKKSTSSAADEKNDYEMPNIAELNKDENGFLLLEADWGLDTVKNIWKQEHSTFKEFDGKSDDNLAENVLPKVKRTLTVKIEEEGGVITAKAKEAFEYTALNGDLLKYDGSYKAFFSTNVGNTLEGLYIFYYPNYNSTSSGSTLDNIIFDNTLGKELNFYVIKQKTDSLTSEKISNQEQNYKMSLTVMENPTKSNWNTNVSIYRAQTVLRTNLNYDISETDARKEIKNQMSLTYQAVKTNGDLGLKVTGTTAGTVLNLGNDLDDKEATDRIYTVKVSVYKAGAAAENFPDDDLVATLDGAKED